jgi:hypothetical protein
MIQGAFRRLATVWDLESAVGIGRMMPLRAGLPGKTKLHCTSTSLIDGNILLDKKKNHAGHGSRAS